MTLIRHIKAPIRRVLDWGVAQGAPRRWDKLRDSLLVLTYHRVLPRDFDELQSVEPGMFVFEDTFELQLTELLKHFKPVDLADWLQRHEEGRTLPERACAITFDDGWRDNYEYAFPILSKLRIPATIFVVSALAGTKYSFWPERLARRLLTSTDNEHSRTPWLDRLIIDSGTNMNSLSNEAISHVISVAKRESDAAIHEHLNEIDELAGTADFESFRDLADWSELAEMAASGLVSIGSHTRHHIRMNDRLNEDEMYDEIVGSLDEIQRECGAHADLFCYPNGDTTPASLELVTKNYRGACTTENGWNTTATPAHALRRVSVHQDRCSTRNAFISRLAGAL